MLVIFSFALFFSNKIIFRKNKEQITKKMLELLIGPVVLVASELRYNRQVLSNATSGRTQAGLLYNHNGCFWKILSKKYLRQISI